MQSSPTALFKQILLLNTKTVLVCSTSITGVTQGSTTRSPFRPDVSSIERWNAGRKHLTDRAGTLLLHAALQGLGTFCTTHSTLPNGSPEIFLL